MYSKSKVVVATVSRATLHTFASDVARSCKTTVVLYRNLWGKGEDYLVSYDAIVCM